MQNITIARFTPVNHDALRAEIVAVIGDHITGISTGPYGVILHLDDSVTPAQITPLEAIVLAHDAGTLTIAQQETSNLATIRINAYTDIGAIPNWAGWTKEQWQTWYAGNISSTQIAEITDLIKARAMLNKMSLVLQRFGLLLIALRNETFPDLQDGEE